MFKPLWLCLLVESPFWTYSHLGFYGDFSYFAKSRTMYDNSVVSVYIFHPHVNKMLPEDWHYPC